MKHSTLTAAVLCILGLGAASSAMANYEVNICAGVVAGGKALSATVNTPMWGYSLGGNSLAGTIGTDDGCSGTFTSPGPRIQVPSGQTGLTIHLKNQLPRTTSIVIPGTVKHMVPQWIQGLTDDPNTAVDESLPRVLSLDEHATAGGGTMTYNWNSLPPGTYMYHSGTHSQVQVQMGLYGAVVHNVTDPVSGTPGVAYDGGTPDDTGDDVQFDEDVVLFYSEVDTQIHDLVTDNPVDTDPNTIDYDQYDMRSIIGYAPKYFLIDVDATTAPSVSVDDSNPSAPPQLNLAGGSSNVLVRFLNSGYGIHVPTLTQGGFSIKAEDAKQYPNAREQYSVELPALKTRDAILNVASGTATTLLDSAMALSNPLDAPGGAAVAMAAGGEIANGDGNGMVLAVSVDSISGSGGSTSSANAPEAQRDNMSVREGGSIGKLLALAMDNDSNAAGTTASILSYPAHGELVSDGSDFTYKHDGSEDEVDSLIYQLTNAAGESSHAGIVIGVAPVNDAPVANDDTVSAKVGQTIEIRALGNDSDADSASIRITGVDESGLGAISAQDQVIVFSAEKEGSETLGYSIADSEGAVAVASIALTVNPADPASGGTLTGSTGAGSSRSNSTASLIPAPVANNDTYRVTVGGTLTIDQTILGVMANDSQDAQVNTDLVRYPRHGAVSMNADGTFTYTHDGSAGEPDRFVYELYNAAGTDQGRVDITVVVPAE